MTIEWPASEQDRFLSITRKKRVVAQRQAALKALIHSSSAGSAAMFVVVVNNDSHKELWPLRENQIKITIIGHQGNDYHHYVVHIRQFLHIPEYPTVLYLLYWWVQTCCNWSGLLQCLIATSDMSAHLVMKETCWGGIAVNECDHTLSSWALPSRHSGCTFVHYMDL